MSDELESLGAPAAPTLPQVTLRYAVRPPLASFKKPEEPEGDATPKDQYPKHGEEDYEVDGIKLSYQQIGAVEYLMASKKRVRILTGKAGAGKSLIIKYLRKRYGLTVSSTTGKAAVSVVGCTVHSLFALNSETWTCFSPGYLFKQMSDSTRDIVIDEASMIGLNMARYLTDQIQKCNKRLILVGDWAQACPVKDTWPFDTSFWRDADRVKLTECHRQSDLAFVTALDEARGGAMSKATQDLFRSRVDPFMKDVPGLVRMYGTNRMTDDWNARKLQEHCEATGNPRFRLEASFTDTRAYKTPSRDPRFIEGAIADSRMAHLADFAVGAQVLFTKNAWGDKAGDYVNGDTGVIEEVIGDPGMAATIQALMVRMDRYDAPVRLERDRTEYKTPLGVPMHYVQGFPLALGWALSIHKSQGMSVDNSWLDMRSILSFPHEGRHGLGYVGLSRARTIEGLHLSEFIPEAVVCDNEVRPWT